MIIYKLIKYSDSFVSVSRFSDSVFCSSIPFDPANTDYQQFKVDVEAGAELLDAEGNVIDGPAFIKTLP